MANNRIAQVSGGGLFDENPHVIYFNARLIEVPFPERTDLQHDDFLRLNQTLIALFKKKHNRSKEHVEIVQKYITEALNGVPLTENTHPYETDKINRFVEALDKLLDNRIEPEKTERFLQTIDLNIKYYIQRCLECIFELKNFAQRKSLILAFLKGEKIEELRQIYFDKKFADSFVNIPADTKKTDGTAVKDEEELEAMKTFLQEIVTSASITPWFTLDQLLLLYEENLASVEPITVSMTIRVRGKLEASTGPPVTPEFLKQRLVDLGIKVKDEASGSVHPFYQDGAENDGARVMVARLVKALIKKYETGGEAVALFDAATQTNYKAVDWERTSERGTGSYHPSEVGDDDVCAVEEILMSPESSETRVERRQPRSPHFLLAEDVHQISPAIQQLALVRDNRSRSLGDIQESLSVDLHSTGRAVAETGVDRVGMARPHPQLREDLSTSPPIYLFGDQNRSLGDLLRESDVPESLSADREVNGFGPPSDEIADRIKDRAEHQVKSDLESSSLHPVATETDYVIVDLLKEIDEWKRRCAYLEDVLTDVKEDTKKEKKEEENTLTYLSKNLREIGDNIDSMTSEQDKPPISLVKGKINEMTNYIKRLGGREADSGASASSSVKPALTDIATTEDDQSPVPDEVGSVEVCGQ